MIKRDELRTPNSCLNNAGSEEPLFVLRAKDRRAPQTIRLWAHMSTNEQEPEKIKEALALAEEMETYRRQHFPEPAQAAPKAAAEVPIGASEYPRR